MAFKVNLSLSLSLSRFHSSAPNWLEVAKPGRCTIHVGIDILEARLVFGLVRGQGE